ncbi:permease [Geosporobacter ferrireducens]|uniref:Permease n=1 Tax=Geosporobacter ferrireducens TaxID=1424294 RepID=A0A1D8GKW7_9FIRM|nr:permease [Geosporobacter ferrireducens]AOT71555.1 permease [Geosporobacter ferrireducens]MTI57867.1 permease [Geosporobacter ferrireducens]
MNGYVMYMVTISLLVLSHFKDRKKTKLALIKAWKSFENILPQLLGVLILVGMLLAAFDAELISRIIGSQSGWMGVTFSTIVGAITLIPGFVAFPTAALLLNNGAGYMQIGAFVSALMMVGVITAPVEIKYFGKRLTIMRNVLAFFFSFVVAYVIGKVVGGI